jgi:hypothetical protein
VVDGFVRYCSILLRDFDPKPSQTHAKKTYPCLRTIVCGADAEFLRRDKSHLATSASHEFHCHSERYLGTDSQECQRLGCCQVKEMSKLTDGVEHSWESGRAVPRTRLRGGTEE